MVIKAYIIFALVILILFLVATNRIMYQAKNQNKIRKGSAISYMCISIFSGLAIASFSIWTFFIS
ncbi:hypothetical protein QUF51_02890 [Bacillus pumilus]|nr:hypothetical protein [Bacillus pumilus]